MSELNIPSYDSLILKDRRIKAIQELYYHSNSESEKLTEFENEQSQINQEVSEDIGEVVEEIGNIKGGSNETLASLATAISSEETRAEGVEQNIDNRLSVVEQLAEISVEGGTIGIATANNFTSRTQEGDAKVPTVAAIVDGTGEGVWDISSHNNGATYADLTAALGANGVNVPEGVRKGGMSVKYIQSSSKQAMTVCLHLTSVSVHLLSAFIRCVTLNPVHIQR